MPQPYAIKYQDIIAGQAMEDIAQAFAEKRYGIFPNQAPAVFEQFRSAIQQSAEEYLGKKIEALDALHHDVTPADINKIRLKIYGDLNKRNDWKKSYYALAADTLKTLFGPDISIQIKLNLSIQLPKDESSTLLLHTDTLSGQSPFECVLWTAITDAFDSNAMYIFDEKDSKKLYQKLPSYQHKGMQQLFEDNRSAANFLNTSAGTCILFSSTLFHGNQVNHTDKTRISLNCRFKSLFSPEYASIPHERVTGTFYEPLFISPVTKIGLEYDDAIAF